MKPLEQPIKKQRTPSQNRALFLHFTNIARELQNKGVTQRGFYQKAKYFDMPCTKEFIHDMWLGMQEKMYKTNSTTMLHKQGQIEEINDALMKGLGETCDIEYMPIPSDEQRQLEKLSYHEDTQVDYPVDESLTLEGIGF
jgi:hypothetical protein